VYVVEIEPLADERGFFARTWCGEEFARRGLNPALAQCSVSFNRQRGTVRGMHLQAAPFAEAKLVRCTRGAVYDVALDLRPDSTSFGRWTARELAADSQRMLFVPEGCAHGFQTLTDQAEVFYQISVPYHAEAAQGVRWDDPRFAIRWPLPVSAISPRDAAFADFAG
jgi:dTDP-4-dehydrorhamnose 3,5-epimerase